MCGRTKYCTLRSVFADPTARFERETSGDKLATELIFCCQLKDRDRDTLRIKAALFVEVGDVPSRFEPGTGEVDYTRVFRVLRELNYAGYIGMEHKASTTPQAAFAAVRRLAGA